MKREGHSEIRSHSRPIRARQITSTSARALHAIASASGRSGYVCNGLMRREITLQTQRFLSAANHQPSSGRDIQLLPTFIWDRFTASRVGRRCS
jgi:hypothetical protein